MSFCLPAELRKAAEGSAVPPGSAPLCPEGQHPCHNAPLLLWAGEKTSWEGRKQLLPAYRGSLLGVPAAESQSWVLHHLMLRSRPKHHFQAGFSIRIPWAREGILHAAVIAPRACCNPHVLLNYSHYR